MFFLSEKKPTKKESNFEPVLLSLKTISKMDIPENPGLNRDLSIQQQLSKKKETSKLKNEDNKVEKISNINDCLVDVIDEEPPQLQKY